MSLARKRENSVVSHGQTRPGGRSARVQASVHKATTELLEEIGRDALTIPAIAERAGVTPSTIYRRWGDLQELLADVAVERFRPEEDPKDTGDARKDLELWVEAFAEEFSSAPGREMIRDVLAGRSGAEMPGAGKPGKCSAYTKVQIEEIAARAKARGVPFPDTTAIMDHVIAPLVYRILFYEPPSAELVRSLIATVYELSLETAT
ncbi:TetR/AcrR family transcriptional regulator [Breoghania sp. L-A4]|uniref:TetR/AcrR family transcriptional regulator n=1 Tax=Breoghania sp. L-A4 TaxID=2304600 RepID=UPI000E35B635|nr:TetR/AcrR family transcriptional regulator [Breoghania sp. L-A4]AXS40022.1 TetR/AcrR family transcriptional regulator [Breoghania sp. L-A4]